MATYKKSSNCCAICNFWSGPRELNRSRDAVSCQGGDKGECNHPKKPLGVRPPTATQKCKYIASIFG